MNLTYTVLLTPEPGEEIVNVTVPAMPGVLTWGRSFDEALEAAREAIALHLEGYLERGQSFPRDRKPRETTGQQRGPRPYVRKVAVIPSVGATAEISRRTA